MVVTAMAFNSMILQEDFTMFCQDSSEYLSVFTEFTENVVEFSKPQNVETSRLRAGEALIRLSETFGKRKISEEFPELMQYGFANLLNAALDLLNDEDPDVRMNVVEFASKLFDEKLCTRICLQKLVEFGLKNLRPVSTWLRPVIDTVFVRVPNPSDLEAVFKRNYLFESGEGINVYNEQVFLKKLFCRELEKYLANPENGSELKGILGDVCESESSIEFGIEFFERSCKNHRLKSLSKSWTNQGYLILNSWRNLLKLIQNRPEIVRGQVQLQNYTDFIDRIDALI